MYHTSSEFTKAIKMDVWYLVYYWKANRASVLAKGLDSIVPSWIQHTLFQLHQSAVRHRIDSEKIP